MGMRCGAIDEIIHGAVNQDLMKQGIEDLEGAKYD